MKIIGSEKFPRAVNPFQRGSFFSIFFMVIFTGFGRAALTLNSPTSETWTDPGPVWVDYESHSSNPTYTVIQWEDSLEGWWRFDNDSRMGENSKNVLDYTGHGHDGTVTGGATPVLGGKFGGAYYFDKSGSVKVDNPISITQDESVTFAAWVKLTPEIRHKNILTGDGPMGTIYRWYVHAGNVQAFLYEDNEMSGFKYVTGNKVIPNDEFHHLVVVLDKTNKKVIFYTDGTLDKSINLPATIRDIDITDLNIGGGYFAFYGNIDEVLFYKRALGAEEIAALYRSDEQRIRISFAPVVELGEYFFNVNEVNQTGEWTVTGWRNIIIDAPNTPPQVTLLNPSHQTHYNTTSLDFYFSGRATDKTSTLKKATFYFGPTGNLLPRKTVDLNEASVDGMFSQTGLGERTYEWNVELEDSLGHKSMASQNFEVFLGRTEFHVALSGSDSNPGTSSQPFRTIQKCADIAYPGDTCIVHAGTYRETVTPARSGYLGAPIIFKGAPGEMVTVSGAEPITNWTRHQGNIFKASLPWDMGKGKNQLFTQGKMVLEARHPNALDVMEETNPVFVIQSGTYTTTTSPKTAIIKDTVNLTQSAGYWTGAIVHAIWSPRYHAITGEVTSSGPGQLQMNLNSDPSSDINQNGIYYLIGHMNALDQPNECVFDRANQSVYLWAPNSVDPNTLSVEAKKRNLAFNLRNRTGIHVKDLSLLSATIEMDPDSQFNQLGNLNARHISHYTLIDESSMGSGTKGIQDSGIILNGTDNVLLNSEIAYSAGNGVTLLGSRNTVQGCNIHHVNYVVTEAAAVQTGGVVTYDNEISDCVLSKSGRALISHSNAVRLKILRNELFQIRYGVEPWDLGAIYSIATNSLGTEIAYNYIHDVNDIAIYLDNSCWNYLVHHNVVEKDPNEKDFWYLALLMNEGGGQNIVHHNTMNAPAYLDTDPKFPPTHGNAVINNIFSLFSFRRSNTPSTPSPEEAIVRNNINLKDLSTEKLNQMFVDYANEDFHLAPTSIAINAGEDLGYFEDKDGNPMPVGMAPDRGAYEFRGCVGNNPVVTIASGERLGVEPLHIQMDGSQSSACEGQITNYYWDFGDHTTGTGAEVEKTYLAGRYEVVLTVTTSSGKTGSSKIVIIVSEAESLPPRDRTKPPIKYSPGPDAEKSTAEFLMMKNVFYVLKEKDLKIPFNLWENPMNLSVYDRKNMKVRTLFKGDHATGAGQEVSWDGRNEDGDLVAAGIYVLQLKAGEKTYTKKIAVLK